MNNAAVTERRLGLCRRLRERTAQLLGRRDHADAASAAARRRLEQDGVADLLGGGLGRRDVVHAARAGHDRHAGALGRLPRGDLVADRFHDAGRRADEAQACLRARTRQRGHLGEEAVAGMHGVGVRRHGGLDDRIGPQVALAGRRRADRHGLVGEAHVQRAGVDVGVDRDRLEPEVAAGPDDADRDLAAVGDQDAPDRRFAHADAATVAISRPVSLTARRTAWATSTAFGPSPWMHAEPAVSGTRDPSTASTTPSSMKSRRLVGGELEVGLRLRPLDDELAVGRVRQVGIDLTDDADVQLLELLAEGHALGRRGPVHHDVVAEVPDRPGDRPRELGAVAEHREEGAVRLDVVQLAAGRAQERLERARLVADVGGGVVRADRHDAAAEAEQVRQARMRADRDAVTHGEGDRALHRQRIAAVEAAGDVRRGDERHDLLVVAQRPVAEALAEVAVDVEGPLGQALSPRQSAGSSSATTSPAPTTPSSSTANERTRPRTSECTSWNCFMTSTRPTTPPLSTTSPSETNGGELGSGRR